MNKYIAFYKNKQTIIEAGSSYQAQQKAVKYFNCKKAWDITVKLVELANGTPYIHSTSSI